MDEYISKTLLLEAINTDITIPHNERCAQLLEAILNAPKVNVREVTYAEWYYDSNGLDWGLGAWKCSKCHTKNDNLGMGKDINPYMFSGSKFCPQCGAIMKPKEKEMSK